MQAKIFRDPLYNYISIDRKRDQWLLQLLDCPETQRLRRIHQLGVSNITYPGADHSRLAHSLGVLHLMQLAWQRIEQIADDGQVRRAKEPLFAAALIHDVGHGPFSHLFEPCLNIDHEEWSKQIILSPDSAINKVLRDVDRLLPLQVAQLIDKNDNDQPSWMKYLLSSQLDVDRLDYLRRDSLFTGASYGHFDWHRILTTFELHGEGSARDIVWPEKSKLAIEEYIFARYYMYQNVYLHKTTRGFEKMIEAMWRRARTLFDQGDNVNLVPAINDFWSAQSPSIEQYLALEEFTVLHQIQNWTKHADKPLQDLARRFLNRNRFAMIEAPASSSGFADGISDFEKRLVALVGQLGFDPVDMYCLKDHVKAKYNQPYFPEKENDEQSVKNAIRLHVQDEDKPVEISRLLGRLKPLTEAPAERIRYYVPEEVRNRAMALQGG